MRRTKSYMPLPQKQPIGTDVQPSSYKRRRSIKPPATKEEEEELQLTKPAFVGRVSAYCTAEGYDQRALFTYYLQKNYKPLLRKESVSFSVKGGTADVFLFAYGVVVFWNMTIPEERDILAQTDQFRTIPIKYTETDDFEFTYGDKPAIAMDRISLENQDHEYKLAISHGIAQSTKLSTFEDGVESIVSQAQYLPYDLAQKGKISLSRSRLSRMMGHLYIEKNKVNLQTNLMDTPEFFWDFQQYERVYLMIIKYLDVRPRAKVLNQKFANLQEMFDMLRTESQSRSTERQEWIVIFLIVTELIIIFSEFILGYLLEWVTR
jgi:uncharacterized Rmd1/YagE family protein